MERAKRRWWTWAVSLIAAAVIFGAVVSGLFQLAVLALPSYREDLSAWVTKVADRPIQIGGVSLVWRGVYPRLDLTDITLYNEAGYEALTAERLSLGFSLLRLATGDLFPNRLELSGLSVAAELGLDGRLRVIGLDTQDTPEGDWLQDLERFARVRIENCDVAFTAPRFFAGAQHLRVQRIDLDRTRAGFDADGQLRLPESQGGPLELALEVSGPPSRPSEWRGEFEIEAGALQPQGWLGKLLLPGARIAARDLDLHVTGEFAEGRLQGSEIELESGPLVVARAGISSGTEEMQLRAELAQAASGAWHLELRELRFDDELLAQGRLDLRLPGEGVRELDADAELLRLGRLTPWLAVWREAPALLQAAGRASGTLEGLILRLRSAPATPLRYSLRARVADLALKPDARFGFSGLSGELSGDESGGRLTLRDAPLRLQLPRLFRNPVSFERLSAQAQWKRERDDWRISIPKLAWKLASIEGQGRLDLALPSGEGRSPELDLDAQFSALDINDAKAFMPETWSADMHAWLQRAIVRGRASRADLKIRGPLADFPFHQRPTGSWNLDIAAAGVTLAFSPDWPQIRDIGAQLRFSGNSLEVQAIGGETQGNRIERATARIPDFAAARLEIEGSLATELARAYAYLAATPLKQSLSGLLQGTRAAGPARVALKLGIPLHDIRHAEVSGTVDLDNAQLFAGSLQQPVSGIQGRLAFDNHGVVAERLTARFEDLPLQARIEARENTHGVVVAEFPFSPRGDGTGASRFLPAMLRNAVSGESRWKAELPLPSSGSTALTLSSDLRGTAVRLPAPLGKPIDSALPVRLAIQVGAPAGAPAAPLRLRLAYDQRLAGDLLLAENAGQWSLAGGRLRLGAAEVEPAVPKAVVLDGRIAELDLDAWGAALSASGGDGPMLTAAEIDAGRLLWKKQAAGATRLSYRPMGEGGWRTEFSGEGVQGRLDWNPQDGGRVEARLQHLVLDLASPTSGPGTAPVAGDPGNTSDPSRWPRVDILCDKLSVGSLALGRLEMRTARIPGGQRLDHLSLGGGALRIDASGQWRRAEQRSSGDLRFDVGSSNIGAVLKAFDYAPNLEAEESQFKGELTWAPGPGLSWANASGGIEVAMADGQLRAVQPGVGRVLGLINFYALPRRLLLNFSDVVGEGLAFDRIQGRFDLVQGNATTDDLQVQAPSLRMDVRGRVGLAARDYDQRVTVYPDVSAGVTLGAALLGGPAVGALVLLAQELLQKPIDQASQLSYRVTGSWDNPRIERGEAAPEPRR